MNWYKKYIFAKLRIYDLRDFLKVLKNFGVKYIRGGKGDHQLWGWIDAEGNKRSASIPVGTSSREVNPVTMKKIIDNLNIPWGDFKRGKPQEQMVIEEPQVEEVSAWQKQPWYIEQQRQLQEANL